MRDLYNFRAHANELSMPPSKMLPQISPPQVRNFLCETPRARHNSLYSLQKPASGTMEAMPVLNSIFRSVRAPSKRCLRSYYVASPRPRASPVVVVPCADMHSHRPRRSRQISGQRLSIGHRLFSSSKPRAVSKHPNGFVPPTPEELDELQAVKES